MTIRVRALAISALLILGGCGGESGWTDVAMISCPNAEWSEALTEKETLNFAGAGVCSAAGKQNTGKWRCGKQGYAQVKCK